MKKLGLIVNPIAGMGGKVGLKGTDGPEILKKAIELGAEPMAQSRAITALQKIAHMKEPLELLTCPGQMGEKAALYCGFEPKVLEGISSAQTFPEDTRKAAKTMHELGADLLLFTGGDGTARDVYKAVGDSLVVLGVPAGVKIHSAVYARNPDMAGELSALFLQGKAKKVIDAEVMDIDEDDYREGRLSARLYGYLRIPFRRQFVQRLKAGSSPDESYAQEAIASEVMDNISEDWYYIVGPGTTTRAIMEKLKLDNSLLGVDIVHRNQLVASDANESQILRIISGHQSKLIITPIGGQGYILGRGNQQLSPEVVASVGKDNIIIIATAQKLNALKGRPFLVDTGDRNTDKSLSGFYKVITGYREYVIYKVSP
ncbi:ATP-NAD kinase family protein [Acidobacteriota bacterium]